MKKARVIAFYLPQFHPIPENDEWWGKGFTEWTNVAKAKPIFQGHYQPQIPADLGFYDLRLPEVREAQAELAKKCGIEGFCYWHYWFGNGKRLLERPFSEVLATGKPDFPFCLGWANHSWSNKTWQKTGVVQKDVVFIEQRYLGDKDYILHFNEVLMAFKDPRYIRVDGKPLFLIFDPEAVPELKHFVKLWQKLAVQNGLKGIHFVGKLSSVGRFTMSMLKKNCGINDSPARYQRILDCGVDAINSSGFRRAEMLISNKYIKITKRVINKFTGGIIADLYDYGKIMEHFYEEEDAKENIYPTIVPRWDKTPRQGKQAYIYTNSTPEKFERSVRKAVSLLRNKSEEHKILFLQAWNEWGEGNYMEPDLKYGHAYMEALKRVIFEK